MKRVAIFGSRGYIGSQLAFYMPSKGWLVSEFDLPEADVTSKDFWTGFSPNDYDAILFFAGMTGTEKSFAEAKSFVSINEMGLLGLLQKISGLGDKAPFVIFPSSRLVYKGSEHPLSEDAPKESKTVYAANKIAGESLLQAYGARYGIEHAIVRMCVPYGCITAHNYSYGTIGFFCKQAESGAITLYGDGSLRRTFTHVADICEIVESLAAKRVAGVFNIGGSDLSLKEAAALIARRNHAAIRSIPWPEEAYRMESGSTVFCSDRLADAIGFGNYRTLADTFGVGQG